MNFFIQMFVFLVTVLVLVTVHEFGHFWVAKRLGIKVLRFSIGFGKPLLKWHGKNDTEYFLAWLPLGGYVKLLDEREGPVAQSEKHLAFNSQPFLARVAVVAAGPVINLLFAVLAFWLIFTVGTLQIKPIIGEIKPDSIAAKSGLESGSEIMRVDDHDTQDWQDIVLNLVKRIGDRGQLAIQTKLPNKTEQTYHLPLANWQINNLNPEPLGGLGIVPYHPPVPALIVEVLPGSPGAKAGLQAGDKIVAVNQQKIRDWFDFIKIVQAKPLQVLNVSLMRDGKVVQLTVQTGRKLMNWRWVGYLGVESQSAKWPDFMKVDLKYAPLPALWRSIQEVQSLLSFNFIVLGKMILGKISLQTLGGPVSIFKSANVAFTHGLMAFVGFLGLVSVMLAFVNLLPIPGLDGGHILLFCIEAIRGRPLSIATQVLILRLGIIFLIVLILQATINDFMRLL